MAHREPRIRPPVWGYVKLGQNPGTRGSSDSQGGRTRISGGAGVMSLPPPACVVDTPRSRFGKQATDGPDN